MTQYLIVWKDSVGQLVSTLVDAADNPVLRDEWYVTQNEILIATNEAALLATLERADGRKVAVSTTLARTVLGWDV